jgi:hypothetical protein
MFSNWYLDTMSQRHSMPRRKGKVIETITVIPQNIKGTSHNSFLLVFIQLKVDMLEK